MGVLDGVGGCRSSKYNFLLWKGSFIICGKSQFCCDFHVVISRSHGLLLYYWWHSPFLWLYTGLGVLLSVALHNGDIELPSVWVPVRENALHTPTCLENKKICNQEAVLDSCPYGNKWGEVAGFLAMGFCGPSLSMGVCLLPLHQCRELLTMLENTLLFGICQQNRGGDDFSLALIVCRLCRWGESDGWGGAARLLRWVPQLALSAQSRQHWEAPAIIMDELMPWNFLLIRW